MRAAPARLLPVLYAASGAAALVLEVAWSRLLVLQFGHTTAATSTVLAAFMAGLAGGSALGGRAAQRCSPRGALRLYAGLEVVVAGAALTLPLAIDATRPLLAAAYGDGDGPAFGVARLVVSLLVLAIPTLAIGATYPLAARAAAAWDPSSVPAGRLYAANTIGAAAGALTAGFMLLPALGTRGATLGAALIDVAAAAAAWFLARGEVPSAPTVRPEPRGPSTHARDPVVWIGLAATGTAGFVALASQVAWTRILALVVGPTTFAFSAMLGAFLTGLAGGAALGTRLARGPRPALWLGLTTVATAAATSLGLLVTSRLLIWVADDSAAAGGFGRMVFEQIVVAAILVGPLGVASGASFPLVLALVGRQHLTPNRLALAYGVNTAGAVAGALAAGFLLIPALGLQGSLRACALASVVTGLGVLAVADSRPRARLAAAALVLPMAGGIFAANRWDPALLASGAYRFAPAVLPEHLEPLLGAGELLFYDEGAAATIAVRRLAGTTSLVIDGKPDASTAGDMLTQKMLAHLPLLLHPAPARVGVIGLGSGVTAGAALTHPIASLDVMEIAPGVVAASRFFRAENRGALDDRRTRLLVTDGRSHFRLGESRYDVIVSEPSNPWMAGVAALFTREMMRSVRERLEPDGLFCQWAHTYDIDGEDLRSIVATFLDVFPHASMWLVGEADVLLVGSASPFEDDRAALARGFARPGVGDDLRLVQVGGPDDLAGLRVASTAALRRLAFGADVQTDDRMSLEFSAPRGLASRDGRLNVEAVLALREAPPATTAGGWSSRGRMLLQAEAYGLACDALFAATAGPDAPDEAFELLDRAASAAGRVTEAIAHLRARPETDATRIASRIALARLLVANGQPGDAAAALARVIGADAADDVRLARELASIFADLGSAEHLAPVVALLERQQPGAAETRYFTASLAFLTGDPTGALAAVAPVGAVADGRTHNLRGAALATLGRTAQAREAFARAAAADPRDASILMNAGRLELTAGQTDAARRLFATALAMDPSATAPREGLASIRPGRSTSP